MRLDTSNQCNYSLLIENYALGIVMRRTHPLNSTRLFINLKVELIRCTTYFNEKKIEAKITTMSKKPTQSNGVTNLPFIDRISNFIFNLPFRRLPFLAKWNVLFT